MKGPGRRRAVLHHLQRRIGRTTSLVTLIVFAWMSAHPWNYASATVSRTPVRGQAEEVAQRPQTVFDRFEEVVGGIAEAAGRGGPAIARKGTIAERREALETHRDALDKLDGEVHERLAEVAHRLAASEAPAVARERHQRFVARYEERYRELSRRLDALIDGRGPAPGAALKSRAASGADGAEGLVEFLEAMAPEEPPALDPTELPHRTAEPVEREPYLERERLVEKLTGGSAVRERDAGVESVAQASGPPGPADLAESPEVRFTPEIEALAASLEHDPVRIYNFVRNTITFVPTHGSKLGAQGCLTSGACNATDTASLLIALLRVSGVPARYAAGTVEGPVQKLNPWLGGFTDPRDGLNLMASGGIPVTALVDGGTVQAARFEHVWVEAFVDYAPGRGAAVGSGDTWIPLDAAFKEYEEIPGADLEAVLGSLDFDALELLEDAQASATVAPDLLSGTGVDTDQVTQEIVALRDDAVQHFASTDPDVTVAEVLGDRRIVPKTFDVLPASLPFRGLTEPAAFAQVPAGLRHEVSVTLASSATPFAPALTYTAPLAEVVGKRLTLTYLPATADDEATAESFGGILETPAHLIELAPSVRLEGKLVASGGGLGSGTRQTLTVEFDGPGAGSDRVQHQVNAGGLYAVVLGDGVSPASLRDRQEAISAIREQETATKDEILGQMLDGLGRIYFAQVSVYAEIAQKTMGVVNTNLGREGLLGADLSVASLFGVPTEIGVGGLFIDVQRDVNAPFAKDGESRLARAYMVNSGMYASGLEHSIFESFMRTEGVSAVKLLRVANDAGVTIHFIDQDNADQVLPQLDLPARDVQAFRDGVNAGKIIYAPEQSLSHAGFEGIGYLILDPATGAGGYIISGGLNGGQAEPDDETSSVLDDILNAVNFVLQLILGFLNSTLGLIVGALDLIVSIFEGIVNGTASPSEIAFAIAVWAAFAALGLWIGAQLPGLAGLIVTGGLLGGVFLGSALAGIIITLALVVLVEVALALLAGFIIGEILAFFFEDRRRRDRLASALRRSAGELPGGLEGIRDFLSRAGKGAERPGLARVLAPA